MALAQVVEANMEAKQIEDELWDSAKGPEPSDEKGEGAKAHEEEFVKLTGMTPRRCFRLVLASYSLRMVAMCWMGMVSLEYTRYYVTNDLGFSDFLRAATSSPIHALQAFLFPFWGVVADRVSRKRLIVAASVSFCINSWLLTVIPSVEVFVLTNFMNIVTEIGLPIRDAMLRDIFSAEEWEKSNGGATGVKARMFVLGQTAFMVATAVGMGLLKLGEFGIGLPNEYLLHKAECGEVYCLPRGQFSWNGSWTIDGCLRLLMVMGSVAATLELSVVVFLYPETLRPDKTGKRTLRNFLKSHWRELGRPWNNLRVLATHQLRSLMFIRFLAYVISAGWTSLFLSFYNRFEFDTFTMTCHTLIAGVATWLTTAAVPCLVDRFGDLRGVWLPSTVMMALFAVSCLLLPPGSGIMVYMTYPLLAGPALGFSAMAPELLPKLIPSDVQGTYQTAKSFVHHMTYAIFKWPWNQVFVHSQRFGYPLDGAPLLVALVIIFVAIWMTLRKLRDDPRDSIMQGKALESFRNTPYAKGEWYKYHSGSTCSQQAEGELGPACSSECDAGGKADVEVQAAAALELKVATNAGMQESMGQQGLQAADIDAKVHAVETRCEV